METNESIPDLQQIQRSYANGKDDSQINSSSREEHKGPLEEQVEEEKLTLEETAEFVDSVDTATDSIINLRVAMLGNVDSGKSTLSGILTSAPGSLDDGRGSMRSKVFNFAHE